MGNSKEACEGAKSDDGNPNSGPEAEVDPSLAPSRQASRTPFTNLSQVDADLALARTLQEQCFGHGIGKSIYDAEDERRGSNYGSSEAGSYAYEDDDDDADEDDHAGTDADEDAFDVHEHADAVTNFSIVLDPSAFSSDEAYARALQDAEERDMAVRLMSLAGINDWETDDVEDHDENSQDTWEEVDPDELSYEELVALGEVVGTESRGLSADAIESLPSVTYKAQSSQDGDQCVICRLDYEDEDILTVLSCKHLYHSECLKNWLQINKVCPVCSAEVSTSQNR